MEGRWLAPKFYRFLYTMDASDLFSISSRQPARMPPDIKELPPITRGRSSGLPNRVGSPSESPHQSRRKSAGCCMRTVKEERQQTEPELTAEGVAPDSYLESDQEAAGCPGGASGHELSVSSIRERTGRHRDAHVRHSGSSSRHSSCNA